MTNQTYFQVNYKIDKEMKTKMKLQMVFKINMPELSKGI